MHNFDFTSMIKKYPLLKTKDVSFLNKFFNRKDILEILIEIEKGRNKQYKILLSAFFIVFVGVLFYLLNNPIHNWTAKLLISFVSASSVTAFVLIILIIFSKNKKTVKKNIIPDFIKTMGAGIKYSQGGAYFKESLSNLRSIGMLKKYTRIDFKEDSIKYVIGDKSVDIDGEKQKSIEITGAEIKTSEKRTRRTKNGTNTYYVVTNHCYMMKVDFKNPRFNLKKSIKLLEDISDNYIKKFFKVLGIQASIIFTFLYIISGGENSDGYIDEFLDLAFNNLSVTIIFLIGMFFVIWFIYTFIRGKKRIKLENIDFEKEFDVFSDDGIEARRLLTPSFMYRLVDFVNKINHKRIYEMYFHNNYFYLKYNLLRTNSLSNGRMLKSNNYMEFSKWKNVFKNLEDYVEFYLEIKNITALSKDLKLFYYDKGMMSKQLIK
ncbi:MAG: DUF3137 domain-containing protein [Candidatus Gracilibacteria bacterium]